MCYRRKTDVRKTGRTSAFDPKRTCTPGRVDTSLTLASIVGDFGAPRIGIVGHRGGTHVLSFAGVLGRPFRIVKLIGHARGTKASRARSTLLDGKETAVGGSDTLIAGHVKQRRSK